MKIGVNAKFLTKPYTGIGQYTKNLFRELALIDPKNEYVLVVPEKVNVRFPRNVQIKVLPEKKIGTAGMRKTWWEQIQVPEYFVKIAVDSAFFPYPCNPWTRDWYKKGIKTIVTIHDCIPWMDRKYRSGIMSKMYHSQTKKAVGRADLVFTVSENSKKDIVKFCGANRSKIEVVYNDASDTYRERFSKHDVEETLGRFNLEAGKYFLYVGGYDSRKNIKYLLKEYAQFIKGSDDNVPLVLAGGKLFKGKLYSSFDKSGEIGNVVKTGFLKDQSLAILYQNCRAFVNFSKYEGFNIPIVEAANCGAPLILSDIGVHREIALANAHFVELSDGEGANAMQKILDVGFRDGLCKKSKELAKNYSWKKSAQEVKLKLWN